MMKKAINERNSIRMLKTSNSIHQKKTKIKHNTVKIVQVNLDTASHRKLYSCSTLTKKIIAIPNTNIPVNQRKESKKTIKCYHNKSNSIKEDIRKRNCRSLVKPIIYATPQKLTNNKKQKQFHASPLVTNCTNSNCILTTNFTQNKGKKIEICDSSLKSLKHLQGIFRTSNFKQTIIINEKGNKNLLKINTNHKKKNSKKQFSDSLKGYMPPISYYTHNINNMNKSNNQSNTINKQSENNAETNNIQKNNKVTEYETLLNLLNQSNYSTTINKCDLIVLETNEDKLFCDSYKNIFNTKEREAIDSMEQNNNNSDNKSFLESCYQEELFNSFINNDIKEPTNYNDNISFIYSTLLTNKNDTNTINTNCDQTECFNSEKKDSPINLNTQPYLQNPRLLLKNNKLKLHKKKNTKRDPNQCFIY